jgi:hypothetical protein
MDATTFIVSEWVGQVPPWAAVAIVFLMGGAAKELINAFRDIGKAWISAKKRADSSADRPIDVIGDVHTTYTLLNELLASVTADRVVLLRAENGGNIPTIGKELTSSIVYEVFSETSHAIRDTWQKQTLDDAYVWMLKHVSTDGFVELVTAEMPDGILKTLYMRHNVVASHVWGVYSTEGAYYYLAIGFMDIANVPPRSDAAYRDQVRVAVGKIGGLFDKWHKGRKTRV